MHRLMGITRKISLAFVIWLIPTVSQADSPGELSLPEVTLSTPSAQPTIVQDESGGVDLLGLARDAKEQFKPLPSDHVANAKQRVVSAIKPLERYLNGGTKENAERWKDYLYWTRLMTELAKSEGPDLRELNAIASRYYHNHRGMDLPQFTEMRDALVAYYFAVEMSGDAGLAEKHQDYLNNLITWLSEYEKTPGAELGEQIGQAVGWLERADQAESLVTAIREANWHPNLYAEISERFAAAGISDDVEDSRVVEDCILGTFLIERTKTVGRTDVRLVNRADGAEFEVKLKGTIRSNNVGYNRGVKIYSRGLTNVDSAKRITMRPTGLTTEVSTAHCSTNSSIDRICAKSRLVQKIAWRKAMKDKGKAERIASRHAEQRVAKRVDELAGEYLQQARDGYHDKFRKPLLRRGEFPQKLDFQTKQGKLHVIWRQANALQLAAPGAPPKLEGKHDITLRVHESLVGNFSRAVLGGVTMTDEKLIEMLEESAVEVPEELKVTDDKDPWSIMFSSIRPISAHFSGDTIRLTVRGRRFTLGEQVVPKTMELSATYKYELTPEGARFTRQGDVSVQYVGVTKPTNRQIVMRAVMTRKFEALFRGEFVTQGLLLPGRWEKVGKLQPKHLQSRDGWLTFAWLMTKTDG